MLLSIIAGAARHRTPTMASVLTDWEDNGTSGGGSVAAWYKLDEASGTTAVDSSSNSNNGTASDGNILGGTSIWVGDDYSAAFAASSTDKITVSGITLGASGRGVLAVISITAYQKEIFVEGDISESTVEAGEIPKGYQLHSYYNSSTDYGIALWYYDSTNNSFRSMEFNFYGTVTFSFSTTYTIALNISALTNGSDVEAWVNGVSVGTNPIVGSLANSSLDRLIGNVYTQGASFAGSLNEFVIIDGNIDQTDVDAYHDAYEAAIFASP